MISSFFFEHDWKITGPRYNTPCNMDFFPKTAIVTDALVQALPVMTAQGCVLNLSPFAAHMHRRQVKHLSHSACIVGWQSGYSLGVCWGSLHSGVLHC